MESDATSAISGVALLLDGATVRGGDTVLLEVGRVLQKAKLERVRLDSAANGAGESVTSAHCDVRPLGWCDAWREQDVPHTRIKPMNEETLSLRTRLILGEPHAVLSSTPAHASKSLADASGRDSCSAQMLKPGIAKQPLPNSAKPLRSAIPMRLRHLESRDLSLLSMRRCGHSLPRSPTVDQILDSWCKSRTFTKQRLKLTYLLIERFLAYFDRSIEKLLLPFEMEAHEHALSRNAGAELSPDGERQLRVPPRRPSSIYGAEHLVRFIQNLPQIFPDTSNKAYAGKFHHELFVFLQQLCTFLVRREQQLFGSVHDPAPSTMTPPHTRSSAAPQPSPPPSQPAG
mmetsp:Transcript_12766/g.34318  ORF Transcript_12766/g.34318 Transcript_12766/m.34318 type:complete len:344 (+) Transcript_12766:233-1264(+)